MGQAHSLPSFGLRVGWCDLAMCVTAALGSFYKLIIHDLISFQKEFAVLLDLLTLVAFLSIYH